MGCWETIVIVVGLVWFIAWVIEKTNEYTERMTEKKRDKEAIIRGNKFIEETIHRNCPHCAKRVKLTAKVCKHCNRKISPVLRIPYKYSLQNLSTKDIDLIIKRDFETNYEAYKSSTERHQRIATLQYLIENFPTNMSDPNYALTYLYLSDALKDEKFVEDSMLQALIDKAQTYEMQIRTFIKSTSNKQSQEVSGQLVEWIYSIEEMAIQIDHFQQNSLLQQELKTLPNDIEDLRNQLAHETDEETIMRLNRTLAHNEKQLAMYKREQKAVKIAKLEIDETIAAMGNIYSQIRVGQSIDQMANYNHLLEEISEEVYKLQDHLEALEEVKLDNPNIERLRNRLAEDSDNKKIVNQRRNILDDDNDDKFKENLIT